MWAGPLCVPVGGGPPARSPHASLRLGVVDLEARPGPAAAHRHLGPAPRATRASRFPPCVNLRLGVVDLEAWPSPPDPPVPSTPVGLFIAVHIPSRPRRQAPQSGLSCPAARASPSTPVGLFIAVHIPSRPRRPRAPPPSSTARPLLSRSSRVALHTGGAWCAGGDRRRFKARLCPAAAHRHPPAPRPGSAGLAVPSMREPAARSRRSRSPAKPSGTLHTGGAFHCCAHPIQAPPPTGTAARLRGPRGALNKGRCLVCWWVIGVVLKPGQVLPPPTGTAVGHQPGAVCPALVSNLAR